MCTHAFVLLGCAFECLVESGPRVRLGAPVSAACTNSREVFVQVGDAYQGLACVADVLAIASLHGRQLGHLLVDCY